MNPSVRIALDGILLVALIMALALWGSASAEVEFMQAQHQKLQADLRHWKGIAYRMQDFENQSIHAAQMETMQVYQQMQGELDACRKGQK